MSDRLGGDSRKNAESVSGVFLEFLPAERVWAIRTTASPSCHAQMLCRWARRGREMEDFEGSPLHIPERSPLSLPWSLRLRMKLRGHSDLRPRSLGAFWVVRGSLAEAPPEPHPRIRLALPSSGVDVASTQHRFDIDSTSVS